MTSAVPLQAGQHYRTVVLGAGPAGMACAQALVAGKVGPPIDDNDNNNDNDNGGKPRSVGAVLLLDARDRLGGRTVTDVLTLPDQSTVAVDAGAAFVHGEAASQLAILLC